jgi:5-methylthioadenosine/S-adenosylhomocysteine deaminase
VLDRERMLDAARLGVDEGIRAGITTFADTCDSGVAFDALIERGVRGIMFQEVFGPDPAQCAESMAALRDKIDALRPRETPLVRVGISPHAPYTVSDELFRAAAAYAAESALPMAIHIAESDVETSLVCAADGIFADGLRKRGIAVAPRASSPVALLRDLRVLEARPLLIHCVRVDDDDIEAIAASRCAVAHCPASNAKLGHGIAPLADFLAAGVVVGLGSDSMASNNRMDILEEARLALLWSRARLQQAGGLSARAMLELATRGGARALGLGDAVGSLEVGKAADLAAFHLGDIAPTADPESAAIFAVTGSRARFVAVQGRVLLDDGRLLASDPALPHRVQATADALRQWHALEQGSV